MTPAAAIEHRDRLGRLHRTDGAPAYYRDGTFEWWRHGILIARLTPTELEIPGTGSHPGQTAFHAQFCHGGVCAGWRVDSDAVTAEQVVEHHWVDQ